MNNVPKFEEVMLPILKLMSDGKVRKNGEIKSALFSFMHLDKNIMEIRNVNGNIKFYDNVGFAISHLLMAGLLDRPDRAMYVISKKGRKSVNSGIKSITSQYLKDISDEYRERLNYKKTEKDSCEIANYDGETPESKIETEANIIRQTVMNDLLTNLLHSTPGFFEKVCKDLMLAMGYGYDDVESGKVTQISRDGGIDGIIYTDKLGLEKIYLQAKRYDNGTVGRAAVQAFKGAINNSKGVFITTSTFSNDAIKYANQFESLALVDGQKLVSLMYEHNVGVKVRRVFESKEINTNYFSEE